MILSPVFLHDGSMSFFSKWASLFFSFSILCGDFFIFLWETLRVFPVLARRKDLFFRSCLFIGVQSFWINTAAAGFLGAVLGYQLYLSLHLFGAEALLGGTVGVALLRELGPVVTAFMVTGRAGASIAAEISSMRISEQIDALEVMSVNPLEYLVAPRIIAGFCMLPFLGVFFVIIGSLTASWVACGVMNLQYSIFWNHYLKIVDPIDLMHCLVKSCVFGGLLTCVGCFCGFRAYGGARAVGEATRDTVVASLLVILLFDYFLTAFLPIGMKTLKVTS